MTYYLNFRAQPIGGGAAEPRLWEGEGLSTSWKLVPDEAIPSIVAGMNILFATHGFNVQQSNGAASLGTLGQYLQLPPPALFVAMLWPGDSIIPIVDYPIEGNVAMQSGDFLAEFCNTSCASAQSFSFASHSLGARFVLQAVAKLNRKAQSVCLAAAAINQDCLITEYAAAAEKCAHISLLASNHDWVLKVAFAAGDPFAVLLHDDHALFEAALGLDGPAMPAPAQVSWPWEISATDDYDHFDYLPSFSPTKWPRAADFMKRAFLSQPQIWP